MKFSEFRGQQSRIPTVSNRLVIASDQGIHPSSRPIPCRPIRRRGSFFCLALMLLQQRHFLCQVDDVDHPTKKKNSQLVYSFDPKLKILIDDLTIATLFQLGVLKSSFAPLQGQLTIFVPGTCCGNVTLPGETWN